MNTISTINNVQLISEVFTERLSQLPGGNNVQEIRRKAIEQFTKLGFPLRSNEEYKYSDTSKLFKEGINLAHADDDISKVDFNKYKQKNIDAYHIFLVNGELISTESDKIENNKVEVCDLKTAAEKYDKIFNQYYGSSVAKFNDAFAQLNIALASKGLFVYLKDRAKLDKPLFIHNISTGTDNHFFQTHHLIIAETLCSIDIIEDFYSQTNSNQYILNSLAEIFVKEQGIVNYYKLQNENENAIHINTTHAVQDKQSLFDTNTVSLGGKWGRNNLNILMNGINCESHLNGLFVLKGQQHLDNHTLVDHQNPHCESNQLYKGILSDKSSGVFNGKIYVRKDAQKTNAYQSSKSMLLSDDASMNTKPQLEIYADDVKCSHGSSTGQIDTNALFYLRARGLSEDSARKLLMYAFALDVINTVKIEPYRHYLEELIENSLN